MDQYIIKGGNPLVGEVEIGGAKNAALAILAAAIMTDDTVRLENLPDVNDINVLLEAIGGIGAKVERVDRHTAVINGSTIGDISVDYEYIKNKALLVCELSDDIDEKINLVSEGWPVDRIGKAELAIMRLAVYEMLYDDDIPVNVAINEAVELAKSYGSDDNAASFVNGVLAKLV